jgi:RNA-binding protein 25
MDRKLEPLIHRKIEEYLGELDDDLVMFVIEHLKDRKGPAKLAEGLEPVCTARPMRQIGTDTSTKVLVDEAVPFVIAIWRQIVFESVAYGEALETKSLMVDD